MPEYARDRRERRAADRGDRHRARVGTVPVSDLSAGLHEFQCLIHPWMQAQVEVRDDDHGGGHQHG